MADPRRATRMRFLAVVLADRVSISESLLAAAPLAVLGSYSSIRQFRGSQQWGGCSAFLKHRAARIVRHPIVLKSRLRFGPVRRGVLHQFAGVILTGQALTSQQDKAVSTADDERRH